MEIKYIPIGTVFLYLGIRLQIVEQISDSKCKCRGCYFSKLPSCPTLQIGACSRPWRDKNIIFRKVDSNRKENLHKRYAKK